MILVSVLEVGVVSEKAGSKKEGNRSGKEIDVVVGE